MAEFRVQDAGDSHGARGPRAMSPTAVVLGPLHVTCCVTAANRATPVFEAPPGRSCLRIVTRPPSAQGTPSPASAAHDSAQAPHALLPPPAPSSVTSASSSSSSTSFTGSATTTTAEWEFHRVFPSSAAPTHGSDVYETITRPALERACDGINANVVAIGVHPTQKFRVLFGKSTAVAIGGPPPEPETTLELHGQLGAALAEFFALRSSAGVTRRPPSSGGPRDGGGDPVAAWRLGISSWLLVNNQAVDLLAPTDVGTPTTRPTASTSAVSFASVEARSLTVALQILQTAKTNRIVSKHNAETSHFFVRLALFCAGQVSTLHFVDVADLKDFREPLAVQEKHELYEILHELRPRQHAATSPPHARSPTSSGGGNAAKTMALSNFLVPLLTLNARSFLYTNVLDSRTSLRENVALLNGAANLRGFTCVCKRLRGVDFAQLGFAEPTPDVAPGDAVERSLDSAAAKAMAAVAIGESLLQRLAGSSSPAGPLAPVHAVPTPTPLHRIHGHHGDIGTPPKPTPAVTAAAAASPVVTSSAMTWLEAFKKRKRDILQMTGTAGAVTASDDATDGGPGRSSSTRTAAATSSFPPGARALPLVDEDVTTSGTHDQQPTSTSKGEQLYTRLLESIQGSNNSAASPPQVPTGAAPTPRPSWPLSTPSMPSSQSPLVHRPRASSSSTRPLPITDDDDDGVDHMGLAHVLPCQPPPPPPPPFVLSPPPSAVAAPTAVVHAEPRDPLAAANLPTQSLPAPVVEGLDPTTAARILATDAALLRQNYDALLTVVHEQQRLREAAEARAAEVLDDHEERQAQYEIEIDNLRLEAVGLKSKLRALEKGSPCPQVFEQYEGEIRRLQREVARLRVHNVQLELGAAGLATKDAGPGAVAAVADLQRRCQALVEEREELSRQLAEYRKRDRQFQAQSRLINDSTRRVDQLARQLSAKEEALVSTRLGQQRLSAEVHEAQAAAQQLHAENERLLLEKAATAEELLAAKMYMASVESEHKKAAILERFVQKHGERMSRLTAVGGGGGGGNPSRGEAEPPWARDAHAKDVEDKLLQSIRRGLPQLVPSMLKVLRRLELQELSLREYAEREVDFINLLVELVSDQPALALKAMIEDELRKLHLG